MSVVVGTCGRWTVRDRVSLSGGILHGNKRYWTPAHTYSGWTIDDTWGYDRHTVLSGTIPASNPTSLDFDEHSRTLFEPDAFHYAVLSRTITTNAPANRQFIGFRVRYAITVGDFRFTTYYGWVVEWTGSTSVVKKRIANCCEADLRREVLAAANAYFDANRSNPPLVIQSISGSELQKSDDYGTSGTVRAAELSFTYTAPSGGIRKFIPLYEPNDLRLKHGTDYKAWNVHATIIPAEDINNYDSSHGNTDYGTEDGTNNYSIVPMTATNAALYRRGFTLFKIIYGEQDTPSNEYTVWVIIDTIGSVPKWRFTQWAGSEANALTKLYAIANAYFEGVREGTITPGGGVIINIETGTPAVDGDDRKYGDLIPEPGNKDKELIKNVPVDADQSYQDLTASTTEITDTIHWASADFDDFGQVGLALVETADDDIFLCFRRNVGDWELKLESKYATFSSVSEIENDGQIYTSYHNQHYDKYYASSDKTKRYVSITDAGGRGRGTHIFHVTRVIYVNHAENNKTVSVWVFTYHGYESHKIIATEINLRTDRALAIMAALRENALEQALAATRPDRDEYEEPDNLEDAENEEMEVDNMLDEPCNEVLPVPLITLNEDNTGTAVVGKIPICLQIPERCLSIRRVYYPVGATPVDICSSGIPEDVSQLPLDLSEEEKGLYQVHQYGRDVHGKMHRSPPFILNLDGGGIQNPFDHSNMDGTIPEGPPEPVPLEDGLISPNQRLSHGSCKGVIY